MNSLRHLWSPRFSLCLSLLTAIFLSFSFVAEAQKRRLPIRAPIQKQSKNLLTTKYRTPVPAIVIEEKLAVLRFEPSLTAIPIQRMRTGRTVLITGERQADNLTFFRVSLMPEKSGWVQAEALASGLRRGDDERLAKLIRAAEEFEQLELASIFLENFPKSIFHSPILLLTGDLAEEAAQKLSREALRKFDVDEIQASGAPVYSFYLNFNGLDRYRKIGIEFVFNSTAKQFHYNGGVWREILQKYPESAETAEARKRLDSLSLQMK